MLYEYKMTRSYVICFDVKACIQSIDCPSIYFLFSQSDAADASERRTEWNQRYCWFDGSDDRWLGIVIPYPTNLDGGKWTGTWTTHPLGFLELLSIRKYGKLKKMEHIFNSFWNVILGMVILTLYFIMSDIWYSIYHEVIVG